MPIPADFRGRAEPLTMAAIHARARAMDVPEWNFEAVAVVEAGARGAYLDTGEPTGLYEPQAFHQRTGGRFDHVRDPHGYPLSMAARPLDRAIYGAGGLWQYTKLRLAMDLDRKAALESYSWGQFQVLGLNAEMVGWPDVESFVADMCDSGAHQLDAFVGYLEAADLVEPMRVGDFDTVGELYNGAGYAVFGYHTAMRRVAQAAELRIRAERVRDGAVMFLGDSLARGTGIYWPDAINQAADGSNSRQWLERDVGTLVRRFDPETVLVSLGFNDGEAVADGIAARLREIREEIGDRRVIWMLTKTMPAEHEPAAAAARAAMAAVAQAFGDETFDMRTVAAEVADADPLHYAWTDNGWPRVAQSLQAVVARGKTLGPGWTPPIPSRKPALPLIPVVDVETVQQQVAATSRVTVSRRNRDAAMRRRIDRARRADQRG